MAVRSSAWIAETLREEARELFAESLKAELLLTHIGHEFNETCHSVTFYSTKKDSKRCCDTTTAESIHTKDESKRGSAFAFIFGVN